MTAQILSSRPGKDPAFCGKSESGIANRGKVHLLFGKVRIEFSYMQMYIDGAQDKLFSESIGNIGYRPLSLHT